MCSVSWCDTDHDKPRPPKTWPTVRTPNGSCTVWLATEEAVGKFFNEDPDELSVQDLDH